jgi:hypothetical protein
MQWTLTLLDPNSYSDSWNDLVTYQLGNSSHVVHSIYGVDSPTAVSNITQHDEYSYAPTGPISSAGNIYKIIAWGYDEASVPFAVLYETKSAGQQSESFDIISRTDQGLSKLTLDLIYAAVDATGNQTLIAFKDAVFPIIQDGSRNGQLYPICNETCKTNGMSFKLA